ncbi:MAG TPA: hypothetical protein VFA07_09390 [Chthonomonadaceae bacterium]|nr:hypothetical protein [Chthonomonadaceae bacterium]
MEKYIARYKKSPQAPPEEMHRVKSFPGIQVHDESPRMLLFSADPQTVSTLTETLPDWDVSQQQEYTIPDPRPSILHGPDQT